MAEATVRASVDAVSLSREHRDVLPGQRVVRQPTISAVPIGMT